MKTVLRYMGVNNRTLGRSSGPRDTLIELFVSSFYKRVTILPKAVIAVLDPSGRTRDEWTLI